MVLKFLYNFKTTLALLCSRNESKSPSPHLAIISDFIGTRQRGPRLGFCVSKFSLNPLKFSLTRINWHKNEEPKAEQFTKTSILDLWIWTKHQVPNGYFCTGIPQFILLMWGHTQKTQTKNCVNRGYLVVLKGRKIG